MSPPRTLPLILFFLFTLTAAPAAPPPAEKLPPVDPKTLFLRGTKPELEKDTGALPPPGPVIAEGLAKFDDNKLWRFKDNKTAHLHILEWNWEEITEPGGPPRWILCLTGFNRDLERDSSNNYRADTFHPSEYGDIIKTVWALYYKETTTFRKFREFEVEADKLLEKIKTYTGREPREGDKPFLPSALTLNTPPAPDIRVMNTWSVYDYAKGGLQPARLQVLDWALEKPLKNIHPDTLRTYGKGYAIAVRVRFEDGKEDTLAAGLIHSFNFGVFQLALWQDWARIVSSRQEEPHPELKIRALRDTLPSLWYEEIVLHVPRRALKAGDSNRPVIAQAALKAVDAADQAARSKIYREGSRLTFPGLPPAGFERTREDAVDRSKRHPTTAGPGAAGTKLCLPLGLASWMAWWHDHGVLPAPAPVPDFGDTVGWFNASLPKEMPSPQRQQLFWPQFVKRLNDFGTKLYHKQSLFQVHYDFDCSAENLQRYVQGNDATLLNLTVIEGTTATGTAAIPLISINTGGVLTLSAFGETIEATLKPAAAPLPNVPGNAKPSRDPMELEITTAPDTVKKKLKNIRLILDSRQQDGLVVITAYRRSPGGAKPKPAPAPAR